MCFSEGTYLWTKDDTAVADCLIDLHWSQSSKCISVKGSPCEKVKGKSRINNSQIKHPGPDQISASASRAMQAGADALIGMKVKTYVSDKEKRQIDGYVYFGHVGPEGNDDHLLFVRFDTEEGCARFPPTRG